MTQCLVNARAIKEPELRLIFEGQIAGRLLDLGETDRATKILREGQKIAGELSRSALGGFGRGAFAEELSRIDVPAVLALVEGLDDKNEFDRHHGNLAQRLAATQPAEAERVWQMVKQPLYRDGYAIRVCYAMAPRDLPRARAIAGKINDPYTQAYTLGQMAFVLGQSDKSAAMGLVDEAYSSLAAIASRKKEAYVNTQCSASTAATLLEVVERIDPRQVPETLCWRTGPAWAALRGRARGAGAARNRGRDRDARASLRSRDRACSARARTGPSAAPDRRRRELLSRTALRRSRRH